jgi:phosphoglycerate kinase
LTKENKNIILQNISEHEGGSHTGEISVKQMLDCGIKASIVGHSETRLSPGNPKGDEDREVNLKIKNLIKNECGFILCVGEHERLEPGLHRLNDFADFDSEHFKFVKTQLEKCLDGVEAKDIADNVIAYEPVWAIGKNAKRAATNEEIIEMMKFIKDFIKEKFGVEAHVLYGGSVDENNAKEILNLEGADGLLVGRASSDPEKWEKLLDNISQTKGILANVNEKENLNMKKYNQIPDLNLKVGDRVILRLDLNVPINEKGEIVNDFRIVESLPTIKMLQDLGVKTTIVAHKEKGDFKIISEYLKTKVDKLYFESWESDTTKHQPQNEEVLLMDNVRLNEGEKKNSAEFAKQLANLGDYYINEAFSASHREHASIVGIPNVLGAGKCALGPKFVQEITKLISALSPTHPMLLIVGGAKFDTKLAMLNKFLNIADNIFVGGALAHNLWKQKFNYSLGKSLLDEEVKLEENIVQEVDRKIILPSDVVVESRETKTANQILENERIVDFGEKTLAKILFLAEKSNTIVWNGPLGYYEGGFEWGTKNLLLKLSELQSKFPEKIIILGGGDTVTEIDKLNQELASSGKEKLKFTHVSTGGGAMIDFLSNGTLPGIEAILQ